MALEMAVCAYCGVYKETEPEHVVARSFAPPELRNDCQWVRVRACGKCNRKYSADESDFREFCVLATSPGDNTVKDELFYGAVTRNWRQSDGRGRGALSRRLGQIRKPDGSPLSDRTDLVNVSGLRIAPDGKMLRVVKKIVRGLYYYHFTPKHGFPQVITENRVSVEPIFDPIEDFFYDLPDWHVIHKNVFAYGFADCDEAGLDLPGIDSIWLLDVLRGAGFWAFVASNAAPRM
jgi:hypothetical protein